MKILVFDTETTGLPEKNVSIYDHNKWPYIIQLSYIFYDISNNISVIKDDYVYIRPEVEISEASYEKHGITRELLNDKGVNIRTAMHDFNRFLNIADIVVGHNISFDKRMIFVECIRNRIEQKFTKYEGNNKISKAEYCTMKNTVELCDLYYETKTGKQFKKNPTLSELYKKLFPQAVLPDNLHNSIIDVAVTIRCYMKHRYDLDICEINNEIKSLLIT